MNIADYYAKPDEKPLDRICDDGGFTSIFRSIVCVGDSLSSGEFEARESKEKTLYLDMFEYSWGQYISRMTGSKVSNFSQGGMSAEWYCDSFADEKDFWNKDKAAQCYVIALGANDMTAVINKKIEFGSLDDIASDWHNNKKTFIGYYATIIERYREISPYAKFFLVTCPVMMSESPERHALYDKHRDTLRALAERYDNTYLMDLRTYHPVIDKEYEKNFFLLGHYNPAGYKLAAKIMSSYIDYIIRHNPKDFALAGLIKSDFEHLIPSQIEIIKQENN